MSAPARSYPLVPEPTPEQVATWERELSMDIASVDRVPVAAMPGAYEQPFVVCRDGSCWQSWISPAAEGSRVFEWQEMPPIPGSPRSLSGEYAIDISNPDRREVR